MRAEVKWDKLRAHVTGRKRHMTDIKRLPSITGRDNPYDEGFLAALNEIGSLIHRFDEDRSSDD